MTYIPVNYDKAQKVKFNDGIVDQFSRIRISDPYTLLENSHIADNNNVSECEKLVGTASTTYLPNNSCIVQSVATNGDICTRQTRKCGIYQPAKSLLIYMSCVLNSGNNASTVKSRVGYFDDNDGLYFEFTNNTLSIVQRSSVGGTKIETVVPQANWNGSDKLDGTGTSGITIDLTKTFLCFFNFAWLGVSNCLAGVIVNGVFYTCHTFYHANIIPDVYIRSATLPCRYEILSNGGSGSMKNICCSVISEGGFNIPGRQFSNVSATFKTVGTTISPIVALRIKTGLNFNMNVRVLNAALFRANTRDGQYYVYIFRDVTNVASVLTGSSFQSVVNSYVECDVSSTAITLTNAELIHSGFYSGDSTSTAEIDTKANNSSITKNIDGVSDLYVLCYKSMTSTADLYSSITWREYF